jgi:hypothetical protein
LSQYSFQSLKLLQSKKIAHSTQMNYTFSLFSLCRSISNTWILPGAFFTFMGGKINPLLNFIPYFFEILKLSTEFLLSVKAVTVLISCTSAHTSFRKHKNV